MLFSRFLLLVAEIVPLILVFFAVLRRQRLDSSRWFVAHSPFYSAMIYAVTNIADAGGPLHALDAGCESECTAVRVWAAALSAC